MEAISLTIAGLGTVFYTSMFHFLVHVGGSTVIEKFQGYLNTVRIKNHDVDRAIHDSYLYVLDRMQEQCSLGPVNGWKSGMQIPEKIVDFVKMITKSKNQPYQWEFKQLYSLVDHLSHSIDKGTDPPDILISLPDLMTCEEPGPLLAAKILEKANITDPAFNKFFVEVFPDLFLYAFKEIGLKNRPKVNIVLTNEVLCKIYNEVRMNHCELTELKDDLLSLIYSEKERQLEFESNLEKKLSTIESDILDIRSKLIKQDAFSGSFGAIRGFILLWENERLRGIYPFNAPIITIGRDVFKTIILPDASVSRNHAQLYFQDHGLVILDFSLNGTLINMVRINKNEPTHINWGDTFKIGPFAFQITQDIPQSVLNFFITPTM